MWCRRSVSVWVSVRVDGYNCIQPRKCYRETTYPVEVGYVVASSVNDRLPTFPAERLTLKRKRKAAADTKVNVENEKKC